MESQSQLQQAVVSIIPSVAAPLSLIGSSLICYMILTKRVVNTRTYTRLMLGICVYEIIGSSWTMLGPLPVVKGSSKRALGNVHTCTAQGFFLYLGTMGTLAYNCCLMLYYTLVIRYKWTENGLLRLEPYMHFYANALPWTENIIGLFLKIYNPAPYGQRCGIAKYPTDCVANPDIPCERGQKLNIYVNGFYVPITMASLGFLLLCLLIISCTFRSEAVRSNQSSRNYSSRIKATKAVCYQSIIYATVFFNTYFWVFLRYFLRKETNHPRLLYGVRVISEMLFPLQGFFNFLIFIRPRYQNARKSYPSKSLFWAIKETLSGPARGSPGRRLSLRATSSVIRRLPSRDSFNGEIECNRTIEFSGLAHEGEKSESNLSKSQEDHLVSRGFDNLIGEEIPQGSEEVNRDEKESSCDAETLEEA